MKPLLEIKNLRVSFGGFTAVDGVDLQVHSGELLGIVGESGSGKSVSMMALMGLIDAPGVVSADMLRFDGHDLLKMDATANATSRSWPSKRSLSAVTRPG